MRRWYSRLKPNNRMSGDRSCKVCATTTLLTSDRDTLAFLLGLEKEISWYWKLPLGDALVCVLGMNHDNFGLETRLCLKFEFINYFEQMSLLKALYLRQYYLLNMNMKFLFKASVLWIVILLSQKFAPLSKVFT